MRDKKRKEPNKTRSHMYLDDGTVIMMRQLKKCRRINRKRKKKIKSPITIF